MGNIVTFGEILLRLTPKGFYRFLQNNAMEASFGGAEANCAVALANFGEETCFVTKVPNNDLGMSAINSLRSFGVNTTKVISGGERIGIYFLERGVSQRPSKVIYDRKYSAISQAQISEFDWEEIFNGAEWFHFTGITPALSKNALNICIEACEAAKKLGITISFDVNYRKNLWSLTDAKEAIDKLMKYVDVCITNEEQAKEIFEINAGEGVSSNIIAKEICDKYNCKIAAITIRRTISANQNTFCSMVYNGEDYYFSRKYDISIVDRVGSGDSFCSGLIYGIKNKLKINETLELATAAACLKHSIEEDFNRISLEEVRQLANGNLNGRIKR